jgi:hypothetical protein
MEGSAMASVYLRNLEERDKGLQEAMSETQFVLGGFRAPAGSNLCWAQNSVLGPPAARLRWGKTQILLNRSLLLELPS